MNNCFEGKKIINEITDFIFLEDSLEKADIIFVPGGVWPEPMEMAANLYLEGYSPYILPSGRYSLSKKINTIKNIKQNGNLCSI